MNKNLLIIIIILIIIIVAAYFLIIAPGGSGLEIFGNAPAGSAPPLPS